MDNAKHQQMQGFYHFGAFRLDVAERRFWYENEPISLKPKQFELLFYFVENAGRVTKKSQLLDAIWADTYVEETTLARNISWLRKTLGKYTDGESIIETVPKLGYRFTAEVTRTENNENTLIVEEQIVQYFRGEEIITLNDGMVERTTEQEKEKDEVENTNLAPQVVSSPSRSFSAFTLLFIALAFVSLAGIGFAFYQNNSKIAVQTTDSNVNTKITIENIAVDGTQKAINTGIQVQQGDIINLSVNGEFQTGTDQMWKFEGDKNSKVSTDHTFQKADPWSLVGWVGNETAQNNYFQVSKINSVTADTSGSLYFAINDLKHHSADNRGGFIVNVTLTRPAVIENQQIKIGSVVHLQNQNLNGSGYLDAWGSVKNKPEFSIVPTETMFVSTHENLNRDNGSGSWEIVSATGKGNGATLIFGDKIHLRNRHPDAGYLDNCGWIKDMPVFKSVLNIEKFAVFTTPSKNRDSDGTGIWIVKSSAESDGSPVFEGDSISLENGFTGGGFLNTVGRVDSIPEFEDYDGALLVFIHEPAAFYPNSGIWIISSSKAALK